MRTARLSADSSRAHIKTSPAKTVYDSYLKNADYYANVKRDGGTITYTQTEKGFEAYKGLTKDEIKKSVEESGFEVTEE